jgi:molybdenum cofactor biosynthesis protein B
MTVHAHRASAPTMARVAVLTISDTRDEATDTSGRAARALCTEAGHTVPHYAIVRDEPTTVREWVLARARSGEVDAIVTSGGTGIASRDRTFEALSETFERSLPGFGELFRQLSYVEIGAAAMMSRATAGVVSGVMVFACPGAEAAVRLALTKLILPELGHVVRELRR